ANVAKNSPIRGLEFEPPKEPPPPFEIEAAAGLAGQLRGYATSSGRAQERLGTAKCETDVGWDHGGSTFAASEKACRRSNPVRYSWDLCGAKWGRRPMPFDAPNYSSGRRTIAIGKEMRVSFVCGSRSLAPPERPPFPKPPLAGVPTNKYSTI